MDQRAFTPKYRENLFGIVKEQAFFAFPRSQPIGSPAGIGSEELHVIDVNRRVLGVPGVGPPHEVSVLEVVLTVDSVAPDAERVLIDFQTSVPPKLENSIIDARSTRDLAVYPNLHPVPTGVIRKRIIPASTYPIHAVRARWHAKPRDVSIDVTVASGRAVGTNDRAALKPHLRVIVVRTPEPEKLVVVAANGLLPVEIACAGSLGSVRIVDVVLDPDLVQLLSEGEALLGRGILPVRGTLVQELEAVPPFVRDIRADRGAAVPGIPIHCRRLPALKPVRERQPRPAGRGRRRDLRGCLHHQRRARALPVGARGDGRIPGRLRDHIAV